MKFLEKYYDIWKIKNTKKIYKGHLNNTHLIDAEKWKFIYQEMLEKNPKERIKIYLDVKKYLLSKSKWELIIDLVFTNSWEPILEFNNSFHRIYEYIDNDDIHYLNYEQAFSAWELLWDLHTALIGFSTWYTVCSHHDIEWRLNEMRNVEILIKDNFHKAIFDEILNWINSVNIDMMSNITTIHWDTKIYNFLFKWKKALCMVDVDWFLNRSIYWDIWDWLRTLARKKSDDYNSFDIDLAKSFINWYNTKSKWKIEITESIKAFIVVLYTLISRYFSMMILKDKTFMTWQWDDVSIDEYYGGKILTYLDLINHIRSEYKI